MCLVYVSGACSSLLVCLSYYIYCFYFFFFKQKTAYEMRISDWSSDVCSSDLFVGEVIQRSVGRDDEDIRAEVMAEMRRNFLGDRLCMISTGSAPTTPEVKDFISECFQLPVNEGYGTTEAGSIMSNGRVLRPPVIDYKLIEVQIGRASCRERECQYV